MRSSIDRFASPSYRRGVGCCCCSFGFRLLDRGLCRRDLRSGLGDPRPCLLALRRECRRVDRKQRRSPSDPLAFDCGERRQRACDRRRQEQGFALDIAGQRRRLAAGREQPPGEERRRNQDDDDDYRP